MKGNVVLFGGMIVLLLVGFGCFSLNGNPVAKAKGKEIVAVYLGEKYPGKSLAIDHVSYYHYPGGGTHIVYFVSEGGKMQGNIDVRDGRIAKGEFKEGAGS